MRLSPAGVSRAASWLVLVCLGLGSGAFAQDGPIAPIARRLPPADGKPIEPDLKASLLEAAARAERVAEADAKRARDGEPLDNRSESRALRDIAVLGKALRLAVEHGEFYGKKDFENAETIRQLAEKRIATLEDGAPAQAAIRGATVLGYRSMIDGSLQGYGLQVPETLDLDKPVPLLIWLHGRGDKNTDLHFFAKALGKNAALGGFFDSPDVLTVHPFGRHCVGWKHAGERDVFDVVDDLSQRFLIDPERIVLAGFSMGGAGAWHIGAHYTDAFALVHAGAGFAETARYIKLKPEDFPPSWEQTLWGVYDVPPYVRNLFNLPVVAYSGADDKQIQAARVMEEAFAAEGEKLPHLIGPGMGHKYHPEVAAALQERILAAMEMGRPQRERLSLQTRTLRYGRLDWVELTGLVKHWEDSRVDAHLLEEGGGANLSTQNAAALSLHRTFPAGSRIEIDGVTLNLSEPVERVDLMRDPKGAWRLGRPQGLRKRPGLQGPIDDAFLEPFLVVTPSERSPHPRVQRWLDFELERFQARWKALMRGELRIKPDREVTAEDVKRFHLILWGEPATNSVMGQLAEHLPIESWQGDGFAFAGERYDAAHHLPVLVYPHPSSGRYVVLNSGLTFRENHDRTNSLQNPKLPDWAVLDLRQDPNGDAPGKVVKAGFFDERWEVQ